ncbi:RNA polymerase sigma factor [Mesorhizobium sp. CAU 1732]|uniref:RNA polymerase sigma factor n=1 Tax=Mesorhizobium sp. CAU 1732 TaxID=3140358 RepID=UPI0032600014
MTSNAEDIGAQLIAMLPTLRRFALSLTRSADKADDLVQSACERALANAARYEPDTRFDAWMFRIIRNLWIDRVRREKTAGPTDDIDDRPDLAGISGVQVVEARSTMQSVSDAIDALPDEQREVLLLTCVEDVSYKDAAEVLGIPIGTVMSRLARARRRLAEITGISGGTARSPADKDERR